jgi:hypothetical protein
MGPILGGVTGRASPHPLKFSQIFSKYLEDIHPLKFSQIFSNILDGLKIFWPPPMTPNLKNHGMA